MIRPALLLLTAAAMLPAEISIGMRGGAPVRDAFSTVGAQFRSLPSNWIFGPTLEIRLPKRLGITFDILYSRIGYQEAGREVRGSDWEFPAMLRYRLRDGAVQPFLAGGGSFNKLTGITAPRSSVTGVVFGAGAEIKIPFFRIAPEFRYRHRLEDTINTVNLKSRAGQVLLLVGVTF